MKCQLVAGRTVEAKVAPARGRGLKFAFVKKVKRMFPSPPQGGVD